MFIGSLDEALLAYFGQGAAKLWVPKVQPGWDLKLGQPKSSNSGYKLAKNVASNPKGLEIFLTTNFEGP